jgi:hypothetical protein
MMRLIGGSRIFERWRFIMRMSMAMSMIVTVSMSMVVTVSMIVPVSVTVSMIVRMAMPVRLNVEREQCQRKGNEEQNLSCHLSETSSRCDDCRSTDNGQPRRDVRSRTTTTTIVVPCDTYVELRVELRLCSVAQRQSIEFEFEIGHTTKVSIDVVE